MIFSIIIFSLLIVIILCIIYIIYLKIYKKYTRERFAFMSVALICGLFSTILLQIYSSQGYVSAVINTSNLFFKTKFSLYETDFRDHLLTIICFTVLINFIYKVHKNWNGPISEIHFNKMRFSENPSLFNEAALQFKDFMSSEKLIIPHNNIEKNSRFNIFNISEEEKTPWFENAFELLTFSDPQYKINLEEDYFAEEKVFISKYGTFNQNIAILCVINEPSEKIIKKFIKFTTSQQVPFTKHIIAIKNSKSFSETLSIDGTEIILKSEQEMLENLIDFSSYKHFITDQFKVKEISAGSNLTLEQIYVDLNGKTEEGNLIGQVENFISDWLIDRTENKHLAILGEYGCGKSVLSLKLTYDILHSRKFGDRIPILLELRGKSPRNLNVTEMLSTWGANYRLDASSLLKLHKAGKLLIIFEGFDEMDMIGDREMRLNHFQRLWEFAIPQSKIIITGRPNFFLDNKELKINLGIDKQYDNSHFCEAIYLEKFNPEQIKKALRNTDNNTREQVLDILSNSTNPNFYDLVSRPAILYLVAVIWKDRNLSDIKDKINSAVIISEFIKYAYSRQESKNILFPLSENEREYFMYGIAVGMLFLNDYSNQISKIDLENIILKLYKNFPEEIPLSTSAIQVRREPLKTRMIDNNHAEETILTDVRSCGILVNELSRKDFFKFAHKSFLEYQVSKYFVESILQDKGEYNVIMNSITNSLDISLALFKHSPETIAFTSEILISKLNLVSTDDNLKLGKELFRILYPNKTLGKIPFLAAFLDSLSVSRRFQLIYSILFSIISMVFIFFFKELVFKNIIWLILFVALPVPMIFLIYYKANFSNTGKRVTIWFQCCKQLNIPDNVIYNIVPKSYIEIAKNPQFANSLFELFIISKKIINKK